MAQSDATYPKATPLFVKHSSGLDEGYGTTQGSLLQTGDLRRKYNFAERFSELAIAQTPFFRLVSKVGKKPTDDPQFKFTEKRQSWMKRYVYVVGYQKAGSTNMFNNSTMQTFESSSTPVEAGNTVKLWVATDYESAGNIQNVYNNSEAPINIGAAGTAPEFLLDNQILQINLTDTDGGDTTVSDYILVKIDVGGVGAETSLAAEHANVANVVEAKLVTGKIIRGAKSSAAYLTTFSSDAAVLSVYDKTIHTDVEAMRSYVVGNSYAEGSSLMGKTWKDNPYSTGYGQTQIFRSEFGMTNTARATVLKYEPNEWARVWRDKLIEHKWDIEQTGLFGAQYTDGSDVSHTQGAVDFIAKYGNVFSWTSSKSVDNFLDDMGSYMDPRYNQSGATLYFCDTEVFNWLHKLGGFALANMDTDGRSSTLQARYTTDLAISGRKKVMGLDVTTIRTIHGDMNVARCIALDRHPAKILGINMNYVKYRPLVGNGVSRDTSIYVGVQSLENTGDDKRVDMILTEAGFEWSMPECHAMWS